MVSFIHNNFENLDAKVFERLFYILYRKSISLVVDQEFAPFYNYNNFFPRSFFRGF